MQDNHYETMARIIEYADSVYPKVPETVELRAASGLSDFYFDRLFSHYVGVPPKRYLQFLRREYALTVLESSRDLVEAAFHLGLSGTGRLHDLLVTTEAVTPGEWRSAGAGLEIRHGIQDTRFGKVFIAETDRGICELQFLQNGPIAALVSNLRRRFPAARLREVETPNADIAAYLDHGGQKPDLYLCGTNFQLKVWQALLLVPESTLVTYDQLATAAGSPRGVRAAASAVAKNPIACLIPCHRVIRKTGAFNQYRWGATRKKMLIAHEAARSGLLMGQ
ncbi:methylated-DNA--[protein]-cysteine S-methyltransferase [Turneriella parva]|uniref:DNA-O6-methylguanine--protein-cysteine S-methyltransferase, Transcriptional regulator Ada n=1 Tax=Turneriella parva (strain ATCC BAA-1111 / DSM 21527 / NCTC 11395 / H) TaxID=869212 RepID=I4B8V6_TURPD|nr:methylated-DNA--[protein]-cysteine S-methyltransferase [Turneriella parva]AFM13713.1 DNA-O6-methylguanine--protein-cysteine S-methyltransferase, Transcriptional regulator Ada [Turneriella parva DSM 21527]